MHPACVSNCNAGCVRCLFRSGLVAGAWVRSYAARYPPLRPLVLLLKGLLLQRGVNDVATGGLGSFTLTNMVIAHFQARACW